MAHSELERLLESKVVPALVGKVSSKQAELVLTFLYQGDEFNCSSKFLMTPKGKEYLNKAVSLYVDNASKLFYDYILTDDYFIYCMDNKVYESIMKILKSIADYSSPYKYFVSGVWSGNDTDLQGYSNDPLDAANMYNKNCDLYFKNKWINKIYYWEGETAKGKIKIPPRSELFRNFSEKVHNLFNFAKGSKSGKSTKYDNMTVSELIDAIEYDIELKSELEPKLKSKLNGPKDRKLLEDKIKKFKKTYEGLKYSPTPMGKRAAQTSKSLINMLNKLLSSMK